jgi:hypothetical protein
MPRQTSNTNYQFPDGFALEVSTDGGSIWTDVGIVAAGATATLNWDQVLIDAGNYEQLIKRAKNFTMQLSPSALWNWTAEAISTVFSGILSSSAATSPQTGNDVAFAGVDRYISLTDLQVRMTHYSDAALTTETWQFTLYNANLDAGASFNWKGVNEDGLDEINVSFTGRPDPADGYKMMKLFLAS